MSGKWKKARADLLRRTTTVDFEAMTRTDFGVWIDRLPEAEFFALLDLHDEFRKTDKPAGTSGSPPPKDERPWIDLEVGAPMPVPGDTLIFVRLADGDENDVPMRADSLMWGEPNGGAVIKYFTASPVTP